MAPYFYLVLSISATRNDRIWSSKENGNTQRRVLIFINLISVSHCQSSNWI